MDGSSSVDSDCDCVEYDSDTGNQKPRLNMSHGFIHHIRKNQISRDNYDKEVKKKGKSSKSSSSQRPGVKMYVPPNQRAQTKESESKPLFKLEYTDGMNKVHSVTVHVHDDPEILAKRFCQQACISFVYCETLQWKIQQEIIKHGNTI